MNRETTPPAERVRTVLARFRKDVRRRRGKLGLGVACATVYAAARVVEPWPLKVVFDQVLFHKPANGPWLAPFRVFGTSTYELLAAAGGILVLASVVRGISYYYEDFLLSSAAQEIVYGIRRRLYRQLHRLPVSFHQRRRTGDLLVRLSADIILLRDVLIDAVVNLGTGVILILLMLAVMLAVDPVLTAFSIAVMPVILLGSAFYGRRIRANSRKQRKREGQIAAVMHEALAAMDVVQLYGAGDREQERFEQLNKRSLRQGTHAVRLEARMNRGVELALAAGTVVVLWVGTLRALHGALTPGELVVFISYLRAAYRPIRRMSKTVQRSAKALAAAERVAEVLAVEPDLKDSPDAKLAPPFEGRIRYDDVAFSYLEGDPVLEGISFTAEPGTTVAIVGATGSGKSTLVNLVPRLFDPTAGRVLIDGVDIREFTLDSLREQISVVQQDSVLFGLSIAENIRYGCPDADDEEVRAAAAAAGLDEFLDKLDTIVTEGGDSLSGGQRQRVAIARALIRTPRILILDEPTSGLDAEKQLDVLETFRGLRSQTTTLLVSHDAALIREADRVVVLERGRIATEGTYADLVARSPLFRRLTALGGEAKRTVPGARAARGSGPRVVFYSHNGVGVGHLQRQLDLAGAYRRRHPESAVLLVTGSHAASMFEFPDGIDFVKLPSLAMTDRYRNWDPRDLPVERDDLIELRRQLIVETVRRFGPDLLVADFMPAGPYGELLPALAEVGRRGGRAVVGFRDVLDEPAFIRELWAETGVYETLRGYAAICVYGDPAMVDFESAYGLGPELGRRLHYCGYLGRAPRQTSDVPLFERPIVLATSGGGVDGGSLLQAFVEAAAQLRPRIGGTWIAVTGPLMAYEEHLRIARLAEVSGVLARRIVPELRSYAALADCVVAMPGYNTVCDLLSYRRRAVLSPRTGPSQEQWIRVGRLVEWGLAAAVLPAELDAGRLASIVERALHGGPPPSAPVPLEGVERALDVYDEVLAGAVTASLVESGR